jgi:hypothetical protein
VRKRAQEKKKRKRAQEKNEKGAKRKWKNLPREIETKKNFVGRNDFEQSGIK